MAVVAELQLPGFKRVAVPGPPIPTFYKGEVHGSAASREKKYATIEKDINPFPPSQKNPHTHTRAQTNQKFFLFLLQKSWV